MRWRGDLGVAALTLGLLLGWELAGLDLPLSAVFGDGFGFAWRDNVWTRSVLHDGARWLAAAVLLLLVVAALRPRRLGWQDPARRAHALALGMVLACLLLVPTIKQFTTSSCPYELQPFGGTVAYVPHWMLGVVDGGPGHCFPSGHAVTALCFFGVYFGWRRQWPVAARSALALTLLAAAVLGATQLVRGAHFASHALWSAWLCGSACAVMDAVWRSRTRAPLQQAG